VERLSRRNSTAAQQHRRHRAAAGKEYAAVTDSDMIWLSSHLFNLLCIANSSCFDCSVGSWYCVLAEVSLDL
jgi:hypothetical protein